MKEHFDVITIGSGAGGGTLLNRLAPSGKRILVLERGPFLPREKKNWTYHGSFIWDALRPVEQLQAIFGYRNAYVFPECVFMPGIGKSLGAAGNFSSP